MSKVKTFEELCALGVNTIHEHTHISRAKLELLFNKSFGELNRVQFMGFLSILEREYNIDLSTLRTEYDVYLNGHPEVTLPKASVIFQAESHGRRLWILGGIVLIALLIGAVVMVQKEFSTFPKEEVITLNSAEMNVSETSIIEHNSTDESNLSENNNSDRNLTNIRDNNSTLKISEMLNLGSIVRINPSSKVWVGMMDLETGVKAQKTTKEAIVIDTSKNWLFIFGHGRLTLIGEESNTTLKERNTVWFSYENGLLYQLSEEEFNKKNNGSNW